MSVPKVFGVYGESDSGKTTLIIQLVSRFTQEGFQVATVKQTNKAISMDTKQKDTWRHHQAGAHLVVFSSKSETDFLLDTSLSSAEIVRRIIEFRAVDFILIEGADDPDVPKIRVGSGKKRVNTIATYTNNFHEIFCLLKTCKPLESYIPDLRIHVNGKNIPLTEFPSQIISNTIIGMIGSLKGVQEIHSIILELKI